MTTKQREAIKTLILVASELRIVVQNQDLTMTRQGEQATLAKYLDRVDAAAIEVFSSVLFPDNSVLREETRETSPKSPNYENSEIAFLCR